MKVNKKILTLGVLGLLPISILPLAVISCSGQEEEIKYFELEGLRIASDGTVMGYANSDYHHFGKLEIKEKYDGVTIKHIADKAFDNQTGINELVLPKTLVSIGYSAFNNIASPVLYSSDHDPEKPIEWDLSHLENLESIGSFAFSSSEINKQKLLLDLSSLNKLKVINERVFDNRGISFLNLPPSITTIGKSAFANNRLTSLDISLSITTIEFAAFSGNQLTSITLPNSITTIFGHAFKSNELTSITLPDSITTIEKFAFASNKLTSITLPNSITTIEFAAFSGNQINSLNIPESVTTIGNFAFSDNAFTPTSEITLPTQFDNDAERARIGLPPKTTPSAPLETDFIPLTIENRVKGKLK